MPSLQVMQFGRIDGNAYILDFQYPFSAVQAFAVALANVTQRLKWRDWLGEQKETEEPFQRGLITDGRGARKGLSAWGPEDKSKLEKSLRLRRGHWPLALSFVWAFIILYCLSF